MSHPQCCGDDHRAQHVWKNVPQENTRAAGAQRTRRNHEILALDSKNLTPHQPAQAVPPGKSDDDDKPKQRELPPRGENGDEEQQARNRKQRVEQSHHHRLDRSAGKPGNGTIRRPERDAHQRRDERHGERHSPSIEHPAQNVAAGRISAERVRKRRRLAPQRDDVGLRQRVVGSEDRRGDAWHDDQQQDDGGSDCRAVRREPPPRPRVFASAR